MSFDPNTSTTCPRCGTDDENKTWSIRLHGYCRECLPGVRLESLSPVCGDEARFVADDEGNYATSVCNLFLGHGGEHMVVTATWPALTGEPA
jgi:hypothetical protein